MSFNENIDVDELESILQQHSRNLVNAILAAEESYQDLQQANIASTNVFTRTIYDLPDTGERVLSVNSSTKRIECQAGAGFFTGFQIGRNVTNTGFSNGANNSPDDTLITDAGSDFIELDNSTNLVTEADTVDARVKSDGFSDETDIVTAGENTSDAWHEIYNFVNNVASPVQGDRLALLRDFT
jgi:hypothetical protein